MDVDKESQIQLAIKAISELRVSSVRQAAQIFGVPRSTLQARMKGRKTQAGASRPQQRLTEAEEESIVRLILQMQVWGWPITIESLRNLATQLLQAKKDFEPLGVNWQEGFKKRHPEVKLKRARNLDQQRRDGTSYESISHWFETYQRIRLSYNIAIEDTYNMDEKGLMKGIGDNAKVFIDAKNKDAITNQPGNREWVSVIECIGTKDYILPPFIIFAGKQIQEAWIDPSIRDDTVIQVSPNGWTDNSIAVTWLEHFNRHTEAQTQGQYRLLILDGHGSHETFEFVEYCEQHKIIPLCLPPHTTHVLQPLDVGIFSPLAKAYKKLVSRGAVYGAQRITNRQFLCYYQEARQCIKRNIPSAWKAVGLHPYHTEGILANFKPTSSPFSDSSTGTSTSINGATTINNQIDELAREILRVCNTPLRAKVTFMQKTCQEALTDKQTLQIINEELIEKQRKQRKAGKKGFGEARVLSLGEMKKKKAEREAVEKEKMTEKARKAALYGKGKFAKLAWKELPMEPFLLGGGPEDDEE